MSLLEKSKPALLYTGIAAAAFGAAAFSVILRPTTDQSANARPGSNCESITNQKTPQHLLQQIGCTMQHGYHIGIR